LEPLHTKIVQYRLSKEAGRRLKWIDYYHEKKSVVETCRHFDITRSLFYKWLSRFERLGSKGLEDQSRRPKTLRKCEVLLEVQAAIREVREENKAWSKYKVAEMLKRDYGFVISFSPVNRVFHDKQLFWSKPISNAQIGSRKA